MGNLPPSSNEVSSLTMGQQALGGLAALVYSVLELAHATRMGKEH